MSNQKSKSLQRLKRHNKIRSTISGDAKIPRLNIFRSNKSIYLQIIDDQKGVTLVSAHTKELKSSDKKVDQSLELGKLLAKKAIEKKITKVVFDRGGYRYLGRVAAVAEGAREGGLEF